MKLLKQENVQICDTAADWRDAIKISVLPLEQSGYVESRYKDGIIENLEKFGPYIIIADHIALPHARPEQGAIDTQISITLFRQDIKFDNPENNSGEDDSDECKSEANREDAPAADCREDRKESAARLFVTLAAKDNNSHLDALVQISELLSDEEIVDKILEAPDTQTLYHYFDRI